MSTPRRFVGEYDPSTRRAMETAIRQHPGVATIGTTAPDGRYELYAAFGPMDDPMLDFWKTFDRITGRPTEEVFHG